MDPVLLEGLKGPLSKGSDVEYALVFGSEARGRSHSGSDLDVAVSLTPTASRSATAVGSLVADLERASGRTVDLILLDEAPITLAYRIFREGEIITIRNRERFLARKARAILDYLDFQAYEERCVRGVLKAAARG